MRLKWCLCLCLVVQNLHAGVNLVSPQPLDLGKVLEKTVVEGRFALVNESDSTFHIRYVMTSCHCTVTTIPDSTLDPRDTVYVPFSINTARFSGVIRKIITVQFKEEIPEIEAVAQVQVFQTLETKPRILTCRNLKLGSEPVSRSVSIINNSLRAVKIIKAQTSDSSLTVTPDKTVVPSMGEAVFQVEFSPVKPGSATLYVTLETDDEETSIIEFPVSVQVIP
jgi:hypothetical protein